MTRTTIRTKFATAAAAAVAASAVAASSLTAAPAMAEEVPITDPTDPNPISLGHFDVKVSPAPTDDSLHHINVTTCAKNLAPGEQVRVSWDRWSIYNVDGQEFRAGAYEGVSAIDTYPYADGAAHNGGYDTERYLANGECATGNLSFAVEGHSTGIVYLNGYGEKAVWALDG